jgi:hypothetical protein
MSTRSVSVRPLAAAAICLAAWAPLVCAQSVRPSPANELGQKAIRRLMLGRGSVTHAFGVQPFVRPAITDDDWNGGAGNWNSTNWSLGSAPTSPVRRP